ncbi:hypothetical protein EA187_15275 [Lujinxingia sediminis]|uniref:CpXC domain-containing protein n=2 Tax=Lujinxingia sediminis TaxID=2480984 RepID=A0ABY0CQV6_9DELT|nr:hypothetical protein EA187_15275 [Lujinxingia sediminis]
MVCSTTGHEPLSFYAFDALWRGTSMEYHDGAQAPYQGHLGRTAQTSVLISSAAGPVFPASVYTGINIQTHPELRQRLIDGTLNVVECPFDDGRIYDLAISVIYHDEKRRLFVLVIPETLRHEEFKRRSALLEELAREREVLPNYVRNFHTIFEPSRLIALEEAADRAAEAGQPQAPTPQDSSEVGEATVITTTAPSGPSEAEEALQAELETLKSELAGQRESLNEARAELERAQRALENSQSGVQEEQEAIARDRQQLNEVASRVERASARVQDTRTRLEEERTRLEEERAMLEEARRALQVQELNLEQERLRLEQGAQSSNAEEATQVVTDDQFIEVMNPSVAPTPPGAASLRDTGSEPARRPEPARHQLVRATPAELPGNFDAAADGELVFVRETSDLVQVGYSLSDERVATYEDAAEVRFFFQLHDVDGVPVMALTLAAFDASGELLDAVGAPLADGGDTERAILDTLARDQHVSLVIYGEQGSPAISWEGGAPIAANIAWARERARAWRDAFNGDDSEARAAIALGEVELVGQMRHPFVDGRFSRIDSASEAMLAAGVVGYWSRSEQVAYLVGNRAFPLSLFREIQKRVARQALHWGIALGDELQQVAIDESIITDRISLTQRLLASFAELCVGVRPNDLDPIQQWENWDALIQLAQSHGVTPEPDVLELAELSLKRAQDYEDMLDAEDESLEAEAIDLDDDEILEIVEESEVDQVIIEHTVPASGTTYILVDTARIEDLPVMEKARRGDLQARLGDPAGRLEVAQVLVERFSPHALSDVLEASENMSSVERDALARFMEARAERLTAHLSNLLPTAGAAATLIIARTLVKAGHTDAINALLKALGDEHQCGNPAELASALAGFGDALVDPLSRAIKSSPEDEHLALALAHLEAARPGTLDALSSDRSKHLRRAAKRARQFAG